uniref:Uncharacterized protein n=1 Tax=Utricularia reniformis TaxID=192314 RepID=A0A1Y0B2C1_9LAMI|nr:hypothetical protein AEK19_MT1312 [Utricularia reniformis]ART31513.1 hypothetical protein AEK19_MT1312 [Utricularia reniformis]
MEPFPLRPTDSCEKQSPSPLAKTIPPSLRVRLTEVLCSTGLS